MYFNLSFKCADQNPLWFSSWLGTTKKISTLQQIFEKSWDFAKDVYHVLLTSKKHTGVPHNLWGALREYDVDGCLRLVVKSLYYCSEVCVHVFGVISQPFTMNVRLRQACVLSSLFSIGCVNWIDNHNQVNKGSNFFGNLLCDQ